MKVLITGASGFVAPYVARELKAAGHEPVLSDRAGADPAIYCVDLTDQSSVRRLIQDSKPDAIIHLGGWSHIGRSWEDPAAVFRVNVEGTIHLYRAFAALHGSAGRFLYVSSASVYGDAARELLPLNEQSPTAPDSPYACSRLAAEQVLSVLTRQAGPEVVVARPFNHIGRGQHPSFACPSFARRVAGVKRGQADAVRHGNLSARRDFLHVSDVARAYRLLLEQGRPGQRYVIGSGEAVSIEQILLRLFKLAGIPARHEVDPDLFRPVDCAELRADSRLLRETTGWKPQVTLDSALAEILAEAEELLSLETPNPQ
jgi:GDP-4-dehydro-6-deoxy-D-mannose reductase